LEILNKYQRQKLDETDDSQFYAEPRFVYHLDSNFRKSLTQIYQDEIETNSVILDLMSSWDSYLPSGNKYKKIIGHGLNKQELKRNKAFESYWIQNFNLNQEIPLEDKSIDYCLMVAAWQYLQYPEFLVKEISRVLSKKGKFLISFSNRAFWNKSPNIWINSNEEERIQYVRKVLISNGFQEPRIIRKFTSQNFSLIPFFKVDPFYCVIASKF
tara:strand:+ start:2754 stop:3392 length:639 start_codon:yes stop_codon:yes gene_type:complete